MGTGFTDGYELACRTQELQFGSTEEKTELLKTE